MSNTRTDCIHRVRRVVEFNNMDEMVNFVWREGSMVCNLKNTTALQGEARGYRHHYELSFTITLNDWNELCMRWKMIDKKTRLNKFWKCEGSV